MSDASKETIEILKQAGTAVISDVYDTLGMEPMPLANDLWPTRGYGHSFAGPAYTINGVMQDGLLKGDVDKLEAIDNMNGMKLLDAKKKHGAL